MAILIDRSTRILVQGLTGREASFFAAESLAYGAQIVAGVTPGKGGSQVHGIPVYDCVAAARCDHPAEATLISVPAWAAQDAAQEAFAHGLKLAVIATERIPRRDVVTIVESAAAHGGRVIGPNSLGLIAPGLSRIGAAGGTVDSVRRAYVPGPIGIMSRSGGMMTEIADLLTRHHLGQSTCISIGGDPIVGSTFVDLLPLYEADPQTRALVLFCEPGGSMEEQLAEHVGAHGSRLPIVAFVAGRFADRMQGVRFGHAGALVEGRRGSPAGKVDALRDAGIVIAEKLSQLPRLVREAMGTT
ncbi:MAG: succinate--CoA ligase subunit alpha [Ardenticatenaceae bacterium]|nr:succinate--CoA ligase subunit alpha [Ardenticatenaceae bacterium]